MQTIAISNLKQEKLSYTQTGSFSQWIQKIIASAEESSFGAVAVLIILNVTIAGFNVVIPGILGASVFLMAPGIVMAFISNGVALAQCPMRWILPIFALSMIINAGVSIYCFAQL